MSELDLVHARGRFAPLCWPKEGSAVGTCTTELAEVTCIDCRQMVIAYDEHRPGLGVQQVLESKK